MGLCDLIYAMYSPINIRKASKPPDLFINAKMAEVRVLNVSSLQMCPTAFKVNIQVLLMFILIKNKFLINYLFIFTTLFLYQLR